MLPLTRLSCRWVLALTLALLTIAGHLVAQTVTNEVKPVVSVTVTNDLGWATNWPGVYRVFQISTIISNQPMSRVLPNGRRVPVPRPRPVTVQVFDHYEPTSLNYIIWTNFVARTNGRDMMIWSERTHPEGWPATPPVVTWNTNSLIYGMRGFTAISPCWPVEGSSGQVPVTALTRRHGYTRGHGMGDDGFRTIFRGQKVWFFTANNRRVEAIVDREVVRTHTANGPNDYTILLFSEDLPRTIQPMRVIAITNTIAHYPFLGVEPRPIFQTEQTGRVSAGVGFFNFPTWKGGDSGSPDMLPLPGELVFCSGRSTSGPSPAMQADMDELCRLEGIDPRKYQLQWVTLSEYPVH